MFLICELTEINGHKNSHSISYISLKFGPAALDYITNETITLTSVSSHLWDICFSSVSERVIYSQEIHNKNKCCFKVCRKKLKIGFLLK